MSLRLGKLGSIPSPDDDRNISYKTVAKALAIAEPLRTPKFHYDARPAGARWRMLGNDRYGCCTFAGIVRIMLNNAVRRGQPVPSISDDDVVKAYLESTGGVDSGQMPSVALSYMRNVGIKGLKVVAYARVDTFNIIERQSALQTFGSLYVAAGLPARLDEDRDRRWELTPVDKRMPSDGARTLGGHAYPVFGFQHGEEFAVPWDQEVIEETAWTDYYREESWVFIDSQETDQVLLGIMYAQLAAIRGQSVTASMIDS